jgi:hypothetical protein
MTSALACLPTCSVVRPLLLPCLPCTRLSFSARHAACVLSCCPDSLLPSSCRPSHPALRSVPNVPSCCISSWPTSATISKLSRATAPRSTDWPTPAQRSAPRHHIVWLRWLVQVVRRFRHSRTSHRDNTVAAAPSHDGNDERSNLVRGLWMVVVVGGADAAKSSPVRGVTRE